MVQIEASSPYATAPIGAGNSYMFDIDAEKDGASNGQIHHA